jgi:hypothetical protein
MKLKIPYLIMLFLFCANKGDNNMLEDKNWPMDIKPEIIVADKPISKLASLSIC